MWSFHHSRPPPSPFSNKLNQGLKYILQWPSPSPCLSLSPQNFLETWFTQLRLKPSWFDQIVWRLSLTWKDLAKTTFDPIRAPINPNFKLSNASDNNHAEVLRVNDRSWIGCWVLESSFPDFLQSVCTSVSYNLYRFDVKPGIQKLKNSNPLVVMFMIETTEGLVNLLDSKPLDLNFDSWYLQWLGWWWWSHSSTRSSWLDHHTLVWISLSLATTVNYNLPAHLGLDPMKPISIR